MNHLRRLPRSLSALRVALVAATLAPLLLLSVPAEAGRRPFIWTWDTEVLHEREVELEQWIWEVDKGNKSVAWLWWAPIFGLTDTLELAVPLEGRTAWTRTPGASAGDPDVIQQDTRIARWGLELRWRLAENDPEESGPVVPLLRVAIKRDVTSGWAWLLEGNVVASYDRGDFHTTLDLGIFDRIGDVKGTWATYSWGAIYGDRDGLRFGGEVFGEIGLSEGWKSFTMVGPDIAWTHGRAWLTLGCLIGVTEDAPKLMPRLLWAVKL